MAVFCIRGSEVNSRGSGADGSAGQSLSCRDLLFMCIRVCGLPVVSE